jgi:hypothetical protein
MLRGGTRADIPFLTSSWLQSFRADGALSRFIGNDLYYRAHHKVLDELLSRATNIVLVNADDTNQIIGSGCAERLDEALLFHFVYV